MSDPGEPQGGERVARRNQLMGRGWSGVPPVELARDAGGAVRRMLRLIARERLKLAFVLVVTCVSVALVVVGPRLLGRATDVIVDGLSSDEGIDFGELGGVMLLAAGVYVSAGLLGWLQSYVLAGLVQRVLRDLRRDLEEKVLRLPFSYVDRTPRGDLLSRVTNDIDNMSTTLSFAFSNMLTSLLSLLGIGIMMLTISPLLALAAITLIPLSSLLVRQLSRLSRGRFTAQWAHTGDLNAQVEEAFTGHNLVKVFGRQAEVEERFRETNEALYQSAFRAQVAIGAMQPAMLFLGNLSYLAVAVLGGLRVAAGAMSVGDVQAFIQYSRQFNQPLMQIAGMMNTIQSGIASAERVFQLLEAPEIGDDPDDPVELSHVQGRVEFDHVSFSYEPGKPLIQDLSFVAEPGQTIAIVGPTGAGKTTLVNLIMRFYEIDAGAIRIDGVDIRRMAREHLRSMVGMVLQDTWLLEGTIRDNIRYGRIDASEEEVREAARVAYVDRFVHSMPDGYDTVIDEAGSNLSAGEVQLITIARAFLADPAILILDEATSSVDTRTELLIQHAMAKLQSRRTSFVIAHRLSTIRHADLILMMEDGRIVEQGTHEELIAARGAYFELYNSQFRGPATSDEPDAPVARPRTAATLRPPLPPTA